MNRQWRLINSGYSDPFWNMAWDEALLSNYETHKIPTLRIYGWMKAALSLGFAQDITKVIDIDKCHDLKIPFVRRITGGGMLLHADEITYSIVCSKYDLDRIATVKESFRYLCSFLIGTYHRLGLKACFAAGKRAKEKNTSSFCLLSCQDYDILIDNKKIGGNAQRRKKDLILQHGSIPLSLQFASLKEAVIPCLEDLDLRSTALKDALGYRPDVNFISRLIKESFEESFLCRLKESEPTDNEYATAKILANKKYRCDQWNLGRIRSPAQV